MTKMRLNLLWFCSTFNGKSTTGMPEHMGGDILRNASAAGVFFNNVIN